MIDKKQPLVGIVIVNWNGGDKIVECLTSLNKTTYDNYKVILIDNGSIDDSIIKLKEINKDMDIISLPKNFGYTIATNIGWKHAIEKYNADYICAMDSDIITIQDNWLTLQINELEKNIMNGISCCKLIFPDNTLQLLYLGRPTDNYSEKDEGQFDFIKEVDAVGGAAIIIKTSLIKKLGYYDENFFYGPNDLDYCLRAKKLGYKVIYNGLVKAIHNGSSSYLATNSDNIFEPQSYGNVLVTLRHGGRYAGSKMAAREFVRIFITRKYPFKPISLTNLNCHPHIFKRGSGWFRSVRDAIKNYKMIKNDNYESSIIKNEKD